MTFGGQVMDGAGASVTVKVALQAAFCPQISEALKFTVFDPPHAEGAVWPDRSVAVTLQPPFAWKPLNHVAN